MDIWGGRYSVYHGGCVCRDPFLSVMVPGILDQTLPTPLQIVPFIKLISHYPHEWAIGLWQDLDLSTQFPPPENGSNNTHLHAQGPRWLAVRGQVPGQGRGILLLLSTGLLFACLWPVAPWVTPLPVTSGDLPFPVLEKASWRRAGIPRRRSHCMQV